MFSNALRIFVVLGSIGVWAHAAEADDRVAAVESLESHYEQEMQAFYDTTWPQDPTPAERIEIHRAIPIWKYIPKFIALIEAQPDDEAAFRACRWIIDRTKNVGNREKLIFEADQRAWKVLAAHHVDRPDLPQLCAQATLYDGPAQQQFLRDVLQREDLPSEHIGFATLALAELLAHKMENCGLDRSPPDERDDYIQYMIEQQAPEWGEDLTPANAPQFKIESAQLFRVVLDRYADFPVTFSAPYFRDLKTFRDKAEKSLHALEHLSIGSELPNIVGTDLDGEPLELHDFRGKVVMISAWFTGCGPCVGLIPQEKRLVEQYQGRPFALLGVCGDETREQAQQTAAEHDMDWPNWYCGGTDGQIVRDLNILGWPTIYLIDHAGRIAAKGLSGDMLDAKIAELMAELD
jgi:thiol-disulfide isomerase/thioredoxin